MRHHVERVVRAVVRRPVVVLAVVLALAVGGGVLALGLHPSAGTDTLVSRSSSTFQATDDYHRHFGDDAIIVLIREPVDQLVLTSDFDHSDLKRLIQLEGCLGGRVPPGRQPYGGSASACGDIARAHMVRAVYGPGTFLTEATNQVAGQLRVRLQQGQKQIQQAEAAARQAARAQGLSRAAQDRYAQEAGQLAQQRLFTQLSTLAVQTGINGLPGLNNPDFIQQIVFDANRGVSVPKARFAYLFPNSRSALIQVRLRPGLTDSQRSHAITLIRGALDVRDPKTGARMFALAGGGTYTVTGAPVVVADLAGALTHSIVILLIAAVLVMAATLLLVFRTRPALRLLPLGVALGAAGLTFGGMRLAGVSLTMASIAVLPVLIGLAVDYAIQYQSRVDEEGDVVRGAVAGAPTIATAGLATAVGFLALLLSPIPMVRGFGILLVIGIAVAFACALTAGSAVLTLARRRTVRRPPSRAAIALRSSWRGAGDLLASIPGVTRAAGGVAGGAARTAQRTVVYSARQPRRVLTVGLVLAAAGWVADTQTNVVSDVTKLVPADLPALRDIHQLQDTTKVSGEIDVTVHAADLTAPKVVRWMTAYERTLLRRYGYTEKKGCAQATLCPALSLPDLFNDPRTTASRTAIRSLLGGLPGYFTQAVITAPRPDGVRTDATLAFGIRLMPLDRQQRVIEDMRARLHPPAGVTARLAGLPVLAAEANDKLSSPWRRLGTLVVGLLAVALVLLLVFRDAARALVPLVPIVLATGWSALLIFLTRIPLNPMSATLGALVIAISTEFSVLLAERYRSERAAGRPAPAALRRTYRSTGVAVLASGATAIAGFGVLIFSDVRMLSDFGLVTLVDLTVSVLGVLAVLPAVLVAAERRAAARRPSPAPEPPPARAVAQV